MSAQAVVSVWDEVVGQSAVVDELRAAVADPAAMTHSWLFTGPPGSGRSVAARAFAAALLGTLQGRGERPGSHRSSRSGRTGEQPRMRHRRRIGHRRPQLVDHGRLADHLVPNGRLRTHVTASAWSVVTDRSRPRSIGAKPLNTRSATSSGVPSASTTT